MTRSTFFKAIVCGMVGSILIFRSKMTSIRYFPSVTNIYFFTKLMCLVFIDSCLSSLPPKKVCKEQLGFTLLTNEKGMLS